MTAAADVVSPKSTEVEVPDTALAPDVSHIEASLSRDERHQDRRDARETQHQVFLERLRRGIGPTLSKGMRVIGGVPEADRLSTFR